MALIRRILSSFKSRREEENFLQNGSELQTELIVFFNGRYDIPIRSFSAKQLARATNKYSERVFTKTESVMFRGHLEARQILVNSWTGTGSYFTRHMAVRDIVIASQISHLKNVLKLVGCCLELDFPVSMYEYTGCTLLSDLLDPINTNRLLSWRNRIKIASDIASTIVYLHTAFSRPIIYRNLKPSKVIIDQYGVAKLFDFSTSILLPPGELFVVEDAMTGTYGFLDPDYYRSSYVTLKTDVYSFGVFMLMLITGKTAVWNNHGGRAVYLPDYVKHYADNHQYDTIIDPRLLQEEWGIDTQNLLFSLLGLALMCTRDDREDRPEMIDAAKQLRLMVKGIVIPLPSINS